MKALIRVYSILILSTNLMDMRSLPSINMLQLALCLLARVFGRPFFFLGYPFFYLLCRPFIFCAGLYQDLSAILSRTL